MKKIILFICLLAGINVQGQILGGYVTNSVLTNSYVPYSGATKSVNLGSQILKTTGASTLGSLYVPGAITATGQVNANTLSVTATSTLTGQAKLTATNNIVGLSTVLTQSTVTLTTPASSGTLANLGDAVFPVYLFNAPSSPADGVTNYVGNDGYQMTATSHGTVNLPYNCTLIGWDYSAVVNGVVGSSESATMSISGTTNYTLSSVINFSAASAFNQFSATGLSQSFNANDKINLKFVFPTWATNPTLIYSGITLWLVRRQ